jgi:hypothetical protein
MAFESKRLRVQIPCGGTTLIEQKGAGFDEIRRGFWYCPANSSGCDFGVSVLERPWLEPVYPTIWCPGGSCPGSEYEQPGFGHVVMDASQLPVYRAQLDVQLKQLEGMLAEVGIAEQAVEGHQSED